MCSSISRSNVLPSTGTNIRHPRISSCRKSHTGFCWSPRGVGRHWRVCRRAGRGASGAGQGLYGLDRIGYLPPIARRTTRQIGAQFAALVNNALRLRPRSKGSARMTLSHPIPIPTEPTTRWRAKTRRVEDRPQMRFSQGNQPIQALATASADDSFANRIRHWTSRWRF
jgi:hypothetical protein